MTVTLAGAADPIQVGPGWLLTAPIGSTEPTNLATAWDNAWTCLGYTKGGHTFTVSPKFDGIVVEEELLPVLYAESGGEASVKFELAQMTAANLKIAMNGGTITTATGIVTFEPPALGSAGNVMLGWQSNDARERTVWRKCKQTGAVAIARQKSPNYSTIPAEFMVQAVGGGTKPWSWIGATALAA